MRDVGKYRIVETLGTGGMADVYRAVPRVGLEKAVALKVMRAGMDGQERLFAAEARVALSLSHSHVVQTFEVGRDGDQLYMAMELVDGLNLARLIRAARGREEGVPEAHTLRIAVDVLAGLDYAHRCRGVDGGALGIVHRDVSPENILVSVEGEAKLADFGVAWSTVRPTTLSRTIKGKLVYMAPEQLEGGEVDGRADIYSMGAVLYELLTGRRPFEDTGFGVIHEVLEGNFPRPAVVRPALSPALEAVVLRAMARDRSDRYRSASEMGRAVGEVAYGLGHTLSSLSLGAYVAEMRKDTRRVSPSGAAEAPVVATQVARPRVRAVASR